MMQNLVRVYWRLNIELIGCFAFAEKINTENDASYAIIEAIKQ